MKNIKKVYNVEYNVEYIWVTNITFTGSAMVNWNRGLLIQGVATVIMINVYALGPFSEDS